MDFVRSKGSPRVGFGEFEVLLVKLILIIWRLRFSLKKNYVALTFTCEYTGSELGSGGVNTCILHGFIWGHCIYLTLILLVWIILSEVTLNSNEFEQFQSSS